MRPGQGGDDRTPKEGKNVIPIRRDLFASGSNVPSKSAAAMEAARERFLAQFVFPKQPMGQYTYERWIRFLLATGQLNDYEAGVVDTVNRQASGPTIRQRNVLWRAMARIFPAGCGKWGKP